MKPKFMTRTVRRCSVCGRPRSVLRKFGSAASVSARTRSAGYLPGRDQGVLVRTSDERQHGSDLRPVEPDPQRHLAKHDRVDVPASRAQGETSLKVLEEEGYIASYRCVEEKGRPVLRVCLKYDADGAPIVNGLERVSQPGPAGLRRGQGRSPRSSGGLGISIVSTSQGILTDRQAREAGSAARSSARSGEGTKEIHTCRASEECRSRSPRGSR